MKEKWLLESFKETVGIEESDPLVMSTLDILVLECVEPFIESLQIVLDRNDLSEKVSKSLRRELLKQAKIEAKELDEDSS